MRTLRTEITNFVYPKRKEQDIENLRKTIEQSLKILNEHPNIYNLSELPPDLPFFEFLKINKEEAQQACIKSHQLLLNHWLLNVDKLHGRYDKILLGVYFDLKRREDLKQDQTFHHNLWQIYYSGRDILRRDPMFTIQMNILLSMVFLVVGLIEVIISSQWLSILFAISACLAFFALVRYFLIPACDKLIEKNSYECWYTSRHYNQILDMIKASIDMQKSINEINNDSVKEAFQQYVQIAEKNPTLRKIKNSSDIIFLLSSINYKLLDFLYYLFKEPFQTQDTALNEALMKLAFELFKHRYQKEGKNNDILDHLVHCSLPLKDKIDYLRRYHAIEESYALSSCFLPSKSTRLKALLEEITQNKYTFALNA